MLTEHEPFHPAELATVIWSPDDVPDRRLYGRIQTTAQMLARRLEAPTTQEPRSVRRGAQRFSRNHRIAADLLANRGFAYVASLLFGLSLVLVAHDTMELDLHGRYEPPDAGPLRYPQARGYMLHNSFAIAPVGSGNSGGSVPEILTSSL